MSNKRKVSPQTESTFASPENTLKRVKTRASKYFASSELASTSLPTTIAPDGPQPPPLPSSSSSSSSSAPASQKLTQSLASLLDFSSPALSTHEAISSRFDQIANVLLAESVLVVRVRRCLDSSSHGSRKKDKKTLEPSVHEDDEELEGKHGSETLEGKPGSLRTVIEVQESVETEFKILEAEFYLQKGGCHEDPFTHGSEEQKVAGRWYFHRAPRRSADSHRSMTSLSGYRGGSRKGLDLTFGTLPSTFASTSGATGVAGKDESFNATSNGKEDESGPDPTLLLRGGILLRSLRCIGTTTTTTTTTTITTTTAASSSSASSSSPSSDANTTTTTTTTHKTNPNPNLKRNQKASKSKSKPKTDTGGEDSKDSEYEYEVISGPSLLVDRILLLSGAENISDLVENKWGGDTRAFFSSSLPNSSSSNGSAAADITGSSERDSRWCCMYLRPKSPTSTPVGSGSSPSRVRASTRIYRSPRIGLDLSHPGTTLASADNGSTPLHPRITFLPKPYRYFGHPKALTANGRAQTFLGVLRALVQPNSESQLAHSSSPGSNVDSDTRQSIQKPMDLFSPSLATQIASLTSLTPSTAARYLAEYRAGMTGGRRALEPFVGAKGKGKASSPGGWLRMMGALESVVGVNGR